MNDDLHRQLIQDLLLESYEGLDRFDGELLALEEGYSTADTLNNIFRIIHTIKGTSGCLGLGRIERLGHVGENLLSLLRDGRIQVSKEMITVLLALSDALRAMLKALEETGQEGSADHSDLVSRLEALQSGKPLPAPRGPAPVPQALPPPEPEVVAVPVAPVPEPVASKGTGEAWGLFEEPPADVGSQAENPAPAWGLFEEPVPETEPGARHVEPGLNGSNGSHTGTEHPGDGEGEEAAGVNRLAALQARKEPARENGAAKISTVESAIRVDVGHLDRLMNLVGELVLARNQIVQNTAGGVDSALTAATQRLNQITTELQEGVMKTRMQPIETVWSKFPRIVRDVSMELGKKVRLEMEGKETDLDRTLLEAIKDPLIHLVRNSIDHGIEAPDVRVAAGKPPEGTIYLRAYHEGGQVNIEILDDGRGIQVSKVRQKALDRRLITPEQAAAMADREVFNLIFLPGFSTADKVTNVSGRGVGMDVVRTNIEKVGGSVDVASQEGSGTTIKIKIPLTLAIIPALITQTAGHRFAIPQVSLVELLLLDKSSPEGTVDVLCGAPVYRLRGELLPLLFLERALELRPAPAGGGFVIPDECYVIVLQADSRRFGLVVDAIHDTEEIVVKPLGKQLKSVPCFSGATIMGDGSVALILDVLGLAVHGGVIHQVKDGARMDDLSGATLESNRHTLLVFEAGNMRRMAIPLDQVARLEEIPRTRIELAGGREVVQYRDRILPLIDLARQLGGGSPAPAGSSDAAVHVVVYSLLGRSVGLMVGRIHDIVEQAITVRSDEARAGTLGSAVIQDKVTDLLDVRGVIRRAEPAFFPEDRRKTESISV